MSNQLREVALVSGPQEGGGGGGGGRRGGEKGGLQWPLIFYAHLQHCRKSTFQQLDLLLQVPALTVRIVSCAGSGKSLQQRHVIFLMIQI